MKRRRVTSCIIILACGLARATAAEEGLSRTSWGRFGWWEVSVGPHNRTHIDGLLACNVTLDGLNGIIRTRTGEQWAGGPPYMTKPLPGNCRFWQLEISGSGADGTPDAGQRGDGPATESVKPAVPGRAPAYVRDFNWVTKRIELADYRMTYSLASALVRVRPKANGIKFTWDLPIRHAAYVTDTGVNIAAADNGLFYDAERDGALRENWVLFWHGSAAGYRTDLPMLLVLHNRPARIRGGGNTVTLDGAQPCLEIGPPFGLRQFSGDRTAAWTAETLPADVLRGCRFWSRAALAYPVGNRELYDIDHDREMVAITERYTYETEPDAWGTEPLAIAPLPPVLACLLDAGYPGRVLTPRRDPGFVTCAGPFAASVDTDTAVFEVPIPIEDSFAALNTPGQETQLDELTRGILNLMQRWSGRDWRLMTRDSGPLEHLPPDRDEPMDLERARERALTGDYPTIGIPEEHVSGAPIPNRFASSPLNHSLHVPPFLIADPRVQPGIVAAVRRLTQAMDYVWSDAVFESGVWRVEFEPTFRKPMTYLAKYRYENVTDRANGEAPYDFAALAGHIAYGFRDAALWTGRWDLVRKRWHKLLQVCDSFWRNHDWATGACDNKDSRPNSSVDITWDHYAGLEALARCAYGIGDHEMYDFLCYLRARVALASVCHEALQQYLQPVLHWPDNYFAGHVGEPYPPYSSGLLPEGGVAMDWAAPYPKGARNQIPWRFNNAGTACPAVGLRWMAMTQPRQTRWVLERLARHVPHYPDGSRCAVYGGRETPPFFPSVQGNIAANCLTLRFFLGDPAESVLADFERLSQAPVPIPFNVERMTLIHGRGLLQNLLYTQSSPLWASAWEPRVLRQGRYEPATGTATLRFEAGSAPLRFKGGTRVKPRAVLFNAQELPERAGLGAARARGGWFYSVARATLHVHSAEHGEILLVVRFAPDPASPGPIPRSIPEQPLAGQETNLLHNASFDETCQNLARSPFVGSFSGPFLYVNRWMAPGPGEDHIGPFRNGLVAQTGSPSHTAGLALRLLPGTAARVIQNVAATPGLYRLELRLQLGRRRWDPSVTSARVIFEALQVDSSGIRVLADASLLLAPQQLQRYAWTPVVLDLDAPERTGAIRVGIALESGATKAENPENPVYVDDAVLVRTSNRSADVTRPQPATAAGAGLDAGLVAYWPLDRIGPDRSVPDLSGNGNDGQLAGSPGLMDGRLGSALRFDGVSTGISRPDFPQLNLAREDFTVALWLRTAWDEAGGKTILACGQGTGRYAGVIFQYRCLDSGHGRFETYLARTGEAGYILSRGHPPRINDGLWHHLALSVARDGEAITYVDGIPVHRLDISAWREEPLAARGGIFVGQVPGVKPAFAFELDELRVYARPLSSDEILQLLDLAESAPPQP